jgi:hypothetical protein
MTIDDVGVQPGGLARDRGGGIHPDVPALDQGHGREELTAFERVDERAASAPQAHGGAIRLATR